MKYYLLNKEAVQQDIMTNPILMKTKSASKIKKYRTLLSKVEKLKKEIIKELKQTNTVCSDERIQLLLEKDGEELTCSDFNSIYPVPLYDEPLQRMRSYNKTEILKGKLYGSEIKTEK